MKDENTRETTLSTSLLRSAEAGQQADDSKGEIALKSAEVGVIDLGKGASKPPSPYGPANGTRTVGRPFDVFFSSVDLLPSDGLPSNAFFSSVDGLRSGEQEIGGVGTHPPREGAVAPRWRARARDWVVGERIGGLTVHEDCYGFDGWKRRPKRHPGEILLGQAGGWALVESPSWSNHPWVACKLLDLKRGLRKKRVYYLGFNAEEGRGNRTRHQAILQEFQPGVLEWAIGIIMGTPVPLPSKEYDLDAGAAKAKSDVLRWARDPLSAEERVALLRAIEGAWESGIPWNMDPQTKVQKRYAPQRVMALLETDVVRARQVLDVLLQEGAIGVDVRDKRAKLKGLRVM